MYCPAHFEEDRPEVLRALIASHPLATLVRSSPEGLVADHVPLLHREDGSRYGRLIGHVARANPLWRAAPSEELLLVFQGAQGYVSPNWYASKAVDGRVVPTWNYAVVHVHGRLRPIEDAAGITGIVTALTDTHEASQPHPWQVSDAPAEHTARLIANIVGIEISITRMSGKWKVSQNQPPGNRASLVKALEASGSSEAAVMAALVKGEGRQP